VQNAAVIAQGAPTAKETHAHAALVTLDPRDFQQPNLSRGADVCAATR